MSEIRPRELTDEQLEKLAAKIAAVRDVDIVCEREYWTQDDYYSVFLDGGLGLGKLVVSVHSDCSLDVLREGNHKLGWSKLPRVASLFEQLAKRHHAYRRNVIVADNWHNQEIEEEFKKFLER